MRRYELIAGTAFLICLEACGARSGNNVATPANGAVQANANGTAGAAPAGNGSAAETPVGPCPFPTRGWAAEVTESTEPGGRPSVAVNGEMRPDASGRRTMIFALGEPQAPAYVLELTSDATMEPDADRSWMATGAVYEDYDPAFTHVSVRCGGVEVARVPIRPLPPRQ